MIDNKRFSSFCSHVISATIGGCISLYMGTVNAQTSVGRIDKDVVKLSELQIVEAGGQARICLKIEDGKPLIRIENPNDNQEIRIGMISQVHSKGSRAGVFIKPLKSNAPQACLALDSDDEASLVMGEALSNSQMRLRAGRSLWPGGPNCQIQLGSLTRGHFLAETGEGRAQLFINHLMSGIKIQADESPLPVISREFREKTRKEQLALFQ